MVLPLCTAKCKTLKTTVRSYVIIKSHDYDITPREEIQAWDLQSFLIKPVQRILKYPLLVGKLVECTEEKHPDHRAIQNARDRITQMARDINEIKRRKDIGVSVCLSVLYHICYACEKPALAN